MKKYLGLIPVAIFAILLGCGGGGGGGGSATNGTNVSTTGFTSGDTTAGVDSTIIGQTIDLNSVPIPGVTARFYTSGGTLVATAVSRANGYFDANVPTNTTRCELDATTVPSGFLKLYRYNAKVYQAVGGSITCNRILLPAISAGTLTQMAGAMAFYPSSSPPPFPDGCF